MCTCIFPKLFWKRVFVLIQFSLRKVILNMAYSSVLTSVDKFWNDALLTFRNSAQLRFSISRIRLAFPLGDLQFQFRKTRALLCPTPHSHPSWAQIFASGSSFQMPLVKMSPQMSQILIYSLAEQPLRSFNRPLMRVSLSNSILVTLIFY